MSITARTWIMRRQRMKRNKKTSKANRVDAAKAKAAMEESAIREPPPKTWSATHPAYCFTRLCPVPELRQSPGRR